jgi:hypothetical protein
MKSTKGNPSTPGTGLGTIRKAAREQWLREQNRKAMAAMAAKVEK